MCCDGQDMIHFFASLEINKNYILRQADGNLGYYDMEKEVIAIKIINIFYDSFFQMIYTSI